ncbi:hypothetical protein HA402_007495, partial [Bradysia odoriphaga]
MTIKWAILLTLVHMIFLDGVICFGNCPVECSCGLDDRGRLQTICNKGNMRKFPERQIDANVEVIRITGRGNTFTIGSLFSSFTKLEILQITDSNVPAIGQHSFWGVQSLRMIDLARNNITTITDDNFRGQDGLHELDLSGNKIHRMASGDLRRLNLADNSIEELVSRTFYMLSKLKYLDLSGNSLNDLPPDVFKDITELRDLKCRRCNLKKINPQVYNILQHLSVLDLGDNELKYLEKEEFHDLKRLKQIRIDGNQLSVVIDNLFIRQKSLEFLDLSRNRLAKVTNGAFNNLTNLTHLDLSYNKLVRLDTVSVEPLKRLQHLNISGNLQMDLIDIKDTFQSLRELRSLFVAEMGPLPMELLVPFRQLKALNLSGNHLDNALLQILKPVTSLELLDLSRNQLNGVNAAIASKLRRIKDVILTKNPLICDVCHLGSLISVMPTVRSIRVEWPTIPECFLPESLRGAAVIDINVNALDECMDFFHDEGHDAASTVAQFLRKK